MEIVTFVVMLALLLYVYFGLLVGRARMQYGIHAPATTGDPIFERYFRVQQNTQESLMLFLPGMWMFGTYGNPLVAAGLGVVWIVGRLMYQVSYVADPAKRGPGFMVSFLANVILVLGGGVSAVLQLA